MVSIAQDARYNQASGANRHKSASSEMIRKLLLLVSEYRDLIFSRACFIFGLYCREGCSGCVRSLHDVTANRSGVSSVIFPRGCFIKSSTEWSVKGEQTSAEYTARAAGIQNKNTAVLWIAPSFGNRGEKVNGTRYQITRNSSRCPLRWQLGNTSVTMSRDLKIWSLVARKKGRETR